VDGSGGVEPGEVGAEWLGDIDVFNHVDAFGQLGRRFFDDLRVEFFSSERLLDAGAAIRSIRHPGQADGDLLTFLICGSKKRDILNFRPNPPAQRDR